ncbi:hypothetical protein [Marinitenerispora sediminis]|nr:hypothetical protein [Marinitenerispora sediminis]
MRPLLRLRLLVLGRTDEHRVLAFTAPWAGVERGVARLTGWWTPHG